VKYINPNIMHWRQAIDNFCYAVTGIQLGKWLAWLIRRLWDAKYLIEQDRIDHARR
jgi:hypothetical protein